MSILTDIVDYKKRFIERLPEHVVVSVCDNDFMAAFKSFAVIAECKARSPSEGDIVTDYDPVKIATIYQQAGAGAVSVLTDEHYFGGSFLHLEQVGRQITLPLLCKDFILDKKQVLQARRYGASACLLMMSILTDEQVKNLKVAIENLKMVAVIEVFDQVELQRALTLAPQVILINNRNLHDFSVSFDELKNLCDVVPAGIKIIAASGVKMPSDVAKLPRRVDGVLIGTALMKSEDKVKFISMICPPLKKGEGEVFRAKGGCNIEPHVTNLPAAQDASTPFCKGGDGRGGFEI